MINSRPSFALSLTYLCNRTSKTDMNGVFRYLRLQSEAMHSITYIMYRIPYHVYFVYIRLSIV